MRSLLEAEGSFVCLRVAKGTSVGDHVAAAGVISQGSEKLRRYRREGVSGW